MKLYHKNLDGANQTNNHTLHGQKTTLLSIAITFALTTVGIPPIAFADTPASTSPAAPEPQQPVILKYSKKDGNFSTYVESGELPNVGEERL